MAASVQRSFFPLISGSYFDELTTLKKSPVPACEGTGDHPGCALVYGSPICRMMARISLDVKYFAVFS